MRDGRTAGRRAGAALTVQEVARQAARELTRLVGADTSVFFDYDEGTRQPRAVTGYLVPEAGRYAPRNSALRTSL